jgi:outer membrane protein OmpA-like peptidoglycan-associated protein
VLEPPGAGLVANRFKPIRVLRHNTLHARDGRRHVAIELVPAADFELSEMRRVIAIANAIDHPNLCRPREVLEHADQLVIVTELVEGVSIADRLMIGPFDPLQVGSMMTELLSVLARIHAEGIAHGAISPTTVMIDANGALRLMDIGVMRTAIRPTARLDLEAVGALAKTMLAGYLGSVPQPMLSWIARCPFADAATASSALLAPDTVGSIESPRAPVKKVTIPPKPARTESSVAIKIPARGEPAKPLEVITVERRSRTPSEMINAADALALAAAIKSDVASVEEIEAAAPEPPRPVGVASGDASTRRAYLLVGAVAAAAIAVIAWWSRGGTGEVAPAAVAVIAPPTETPPPSTGRPPLPTGAVIVPEPIRRVPPLPVTKSGDLEVRFSADSAWIETPAVYVLEEAYRQLAKQPAIRVEVVGYSSADGQETRNAQLAVGRAIAVKRYLVERGIDETRIAIAAKPNEPVASDAAARVKSRRAEIKIKP